VTLVARVFCNQDKTYRTLRNSGSFLLGLVTLQEQSRGHPLSLSVFLWVNFMTPSIQTALTMSSREISVLIDKSHSNIKISAERLSISGVIGTLASQEFIHNGNKYTEYLFSKRDSLILVAQNSPEFTAAIVDRCQELESAVKEPAHIIPKTYAEALMLAANQAAQLEQQAPMVEVYKLLADRKGDVSTTIIAKELGTTAIKLNKFLRDKGIKWLNADLPKAGYEKYFNVVADVKNGHEFTQCLVTPDGQIAIAKLWGEK